MPLNGIVKLVLTAQNFYFLWNSLNVLNELFLMLRNRIWDNGKNQNEKKSHFDFCFDHKSCFGDYILAYLRIATNLNEKQSAFAPNSSFTHWIMLMKNLFFSCEQTEWWQKRDEKNMSTSIDIITWTSERKENEIELFVFEDETFIAAAFQLPLINSVKVFHLIFRLFRLIWHRNQKSCFRLRNFLLIQWS